MQANQLRIDPKILTNKLEIFNFGIPIKLDY